MLTVKNSQTGRYYDPEVGQFLNAASPEIIVENAYTGRPIDRNGVMCNNILELLPYMYVVMATLQLFPDPDFDIEKGRPWYVKLYLWNMKIIGDIINWFNNLSNEDKITIGLLFLLVAMVIMICSGGTAAEVGLMLIYFAIGVMTNAFIGGTIALLTGGDLEEGMWNGFADGVLWSGIFAFLYVVNYAVQAAGAASSAASTAEQNVNVTANSEASLQFESVEKLELHFKMHGGEFEGLYTTSSEYLNGANYVLQNGTYISEMNGYLRFFGAKGGANYALVGLSGNGNFITTYGIRSVSTLTKVSWLIP